MEVYLKGEVLNLQRDQSVEFYVLTDEDHTLADSIQATWGPAFFEIISALQKSCQSVDELEQAINDCHLQDFHWEWPGIVRQESSEYIRKTFYYFADGFVEGALHAYFPKQSLVNKGHKLVYVDFVAVAPWNRPKAAGSKRYGGIGTALIRTVIKHSHEQGYEGCIALHSLPQAESYYEGLGMEEHGLDGTYHDLRYFEMENSVASEHLMRVS